MLEVNLLLRHILNVKQSATKKTCINVLLDTFAPFYVP